MAYRLYLTCKTDDGTLVVVDKYIDSTVQDKREIQERAFEYLTARQLFFEGMEIANYIAPENDTSPFPITETLDEIFPKDSLWPKFQCRIKHSTEKKWLEERFMSLEEIENFLLYRTGTGKVVRIEIGLLRMSQYAEINHADRRPDQDYDNIRKLVEGLQDRGKFELMFNAW